MSFRPFTDVLRALGFELDSKAQIDGDKIMAFKKRVSPARVVDVQLWSDGRHRVSHWLHGSMNTLPTDFKTVEEMRGAIEHERTRTDNRDFISAGLENFDGGCVHAEAMFAHLALRDKLSADETAENALARKFGFAIGLKMAASEKKYGWGSAWLRPRWKDDLSVAVRRHVEKGDPIDVAIYAAFAWHHGWSLAVRAPAGAAAAEAIGT